MLTAPLMAADNGLWFNPERDGEGINLITKEDVAVVFFFTYVDQPQPIPPTVSPAPPVVELVNSNSSTWYIGQAGNYDGDSASGKLYAASGLDYPLSVADSVGFTEQVGSFTLVRLDDGWLLDVTWTWNTLVPWYVSLYDLHEFPTPLLTD
jgi:hypothetical protein